MKQLKSHLRKVVRRVVPRLTFALDQAPDFSKLACQNGAQVEGTPHVKFSGWAFKRDALVAVELEIGGQVVDRFFPGKKRADVALVYRGEREAVFSGFERTFRGDVTRALEKLGGALWVVTRGERKRIWVHKPKVEKSTDSYQPLLTAVSNRGKPSGVLHVICPAPLSSEERAKLIRNLERLWNERRTPHLLGKAVELWSPLNDRGERGGGEKKWLLERGFTQGDTWAALPLREGDLVLFLGESAPSHVLLSGLLHLFLREEAVCFLTAASEGERAEIQTEVCSVFGYPPHHHLQKSEFPIFRGQSRLRGIWLSTGREVLARAGDVPIGGALQDGAQFESSGVVQFLAAGYSSTSHERWNEVLEKENPLGILLPYRFSLQEREKSTGVKDALRRQDAFLKELVASSRNGVSRDGVFCSGVFFVTPHRLSAGSSLFGVPVVALEDCGREIRRKGGRSAVQFLATDAWSTRFLPVLNYIFERDMRGKVMFPHYQCADFPEDLKVFPEQGTAERMGDHLASKKVSLEQIVQPGDSPLEVESRSTHRQRGSGISCILPIFNSLDSVLRAIRSIIPQLTAADELIIVNDCSDWGTSSALRRLGKESRGIRLVEREQNGGFIAACASGLAVAAPENDILLLNSDVVLSSLLLHSFREAREKCPDTALFSPFSTGSRKLELDIPPGESLESASRMIQQAVLPKYPTVVTPEGQCLLIRRRAIDALGFFDWNYGRGFCEESDLALRYFLSGEGMRVVDNALIFHEQSASFGDDQRTTQMIKNRPLFERRYGLEYTLLHDAYEERGEVAEVLAKLRSELSSESQQKEESAKVFLENEYLESVSQLGKYRGEQKETPHWLKGADVVFLLPNIAASGGSLSVLQHVQEMLLRGIEARVLYLGRNRLENFPLLTTPRHITVAEALEYRWPAVPFIATHWTTTYLVAEVAKRNPELRGIYYVQDYEPWFYESADHPHFEKATLTYELPLEKVAKTEFLVETVRKIHDLKVTRISPGIDRAVFYPGEEEGADSSHVHEDSLVRPHFIAMYRPSTPRRGGERLLRLFDELLERCPEARITLFGEAEGVPSRLRERIDLYSGLAPKAVAALYRKAHFVVDLSLFHGFGRTGLEGMACGLVPILTPSGGVNEYAVEGVNSIIGSGDEIAELVTRVLHIIHSKEQYLSLRAGALRTAARYSEYRATNDWLRFLGLPLSRGEERESFRRLLHRLFHSEDLPHLGGETGEIAEPLVNR